MSVPVLPLLVLCVAVCIALYRFIIYPAFLSPLARIPAAHPTAHVSSLWILWRRQQWTENAALQTAHKRLGPIIRLGPSEISVNCVDGGLRTIYAGGFEKDVWYPNLFDNYGNVPNLFSTAASKPHSTRKRMVSNVYSKSYLQSSPTMQAVANIIIHGRLLPALDALASSPVDVYNLFNRVTMDIVTGYQFGLRNSSNFIEDEATADWWLGHYQSRKKLTFWPQELPGLTNFLAQIGINLVPPFVSSANKDLENWCLRMVDAATASSTYDPSHPEDYPVVVSQLAAALAKDTTKASPFSIPFADPSIPHRLQIASELLDNLAAGHETSAITLTYLFHELSLRPDLQRQLRDEMLSHNALVLSTPSGAEMELPSHKTTDNLPLLHAVLMETLRRHAAIPGPQPRSTPANATIGPYTSLPAGVRISASAHCLHRIPTVFAEPLSWQPERWLQSSYKSSETQVQKETQQEEQERLAEMHRHFWAFGSGGRMCIGSNLAMLQMKLIICAIISNWMVECHDDEGIEQEDAYTAQPTARRLMLRLVPWS